MGLESDGRKNTKKGIDELMKVFVDQVSQEIKLHKLMHIRGIGKINTIRKKITEQIKTVVRVSKQEKNTEKWDNHQLKSSTIQISMKLLSICPLGFSNYMCRSGVEQKDIIKNDRIEACCDDIRHKLAKKSSTSKAEAEHTQHYSRNSGIESDGTRKTKKRHDGIENQSPNWLLQSDETTQNSAGKIVGRWVSFIPSIRILIDPRIHSKHHHKLHENHRLSNKVWPLYFFDFINTMLAYEFRQQIKWEADLASMIPNERKSNTCEIEISMVINPHRSWTKVVFITAYNCRNWCSDMPVQGALIFKPLVGHEMGKQEKKVSSNFSFFTKVTYCSVGILPFFKAGRNNFLSQTIPDDDNCLVIPISHFLLFKWFFGFSDFVSSHLSYSYPFFHEYFCDNKEKKMETGDEIEVWRKSGNMEKLVKKIQEYDPIFESEEEKKGKNGGGYSIKAADFK